MAAAVTMPDGYSSRNVEEECDAPWERGGKTPPSVDQGVRSPLQCKKM